jgi:hypothetical protein
VRGREPETPRKLCICGGAEVAPIARGAPLRAIRDRGFTIGAGDRTHHARPQGDPRRRVAPARQGARAAGL